MEHEVRQYPRVEFDLTVLRAHAKQIVLAGGCDSNAQMTYQPNRVLAQQLGSDVVDSPGGHLGFLPYTAAFAAAL